MVQAQIEIVLIAAVVAASCALVGSFLVLRRMALMSDAISHAILFGIVLMFFVVESTTSPLLIVAATLTGVLTVLLVEALTRTQLVKEDAAIGLVFPLLFSLGVILITRYASNVHLDVDAVLLGELAFAPFNRTDRVRRRHRAAGAVAGARRRRAEPAVHHPVLQGTEARDVRCGAGRCARVLARADPLRR